MCHFLTNLLCIVTRDTPMKPKSWNSVKGLIIARYGTITELAAELKCHTNAIRGAVRGSCPKVAAKMTKRGIL